MENPCSESALQSSENNAPSRRIVSPISSGWSVSTLCSKFSAALPNFRAPTVREDDFREWAFLKANTILFAEKVCGALHDIGEA